MKYTLLIALLITVFNAKSQTDQNKFLFMIGGPAPTGKVLIWDIVLGNSKIRIHDKDSIEVIVYDKGKANTVVIYQSVTPDSIRHEDKVYRYK